MEVAADLTCSGLRLGESESGHGRPIVRRIAFILRNSAALHISSIVSPSLWEPITHAVDDNRDDRFLSVEVEKNNYIPTG